MERKTKLSKGCLDMKFMKRTKERVEQEEDEEDREQLYQGQLSGLQSGSDRVSIVSSYYDCYEYLPCRLSFGGFEPDTEKLNTTKLKGLYTPIQVELKTEDNDEVHGMEVDIPAVEMDKQFYKNTASHKGTKVNRFSIKEKKPLNQSGRGNNKFNKDNRNEGKGKQHYKKKGNFNKDDKQNESSNSNKRKFKEEDQDCKSNVPRKFLKPSP